VHNSRQVGDIGSLRARASKLFRERFGDSPTHFAFAPGRVNLIGEHTDYNDGFVFPAAIDRYVVVAASPAPDNSKVWSESFPEPAVFNVSEESTTRGWARFPAGCVWTLRRAGSGSSDINAVVVSDLPTGAGLSSSAAIELAFLSLWNEIDRLGKGSKELALLGQSCEHEFIGVNCGVMDQMASALGQDGAAMLIDTRSLEATHVPVPVGLTIVVCDTNKPRSLDVSAYNQRRAECEAAARLFGVDSLRNAPHSALNGTYPQGSGVILKRARHVLTENERCLEFAKALTASDKEAMGRLMRASHESLRDDYEVSCDELDWMAEAAWAAEGCVGGRMTGAGFGGACVALVESDRLDAFLGDAEKGYRERSSGLEPRFLACRAVAGAGTI
jgi:galactokinase